MLDRHLLTLDEDAIMKECASRMESIHRRIG